MSTNQLLGIALAGCAFVIVVAVVGTTFLTKEPPPPPPPPPPAPEVTVTGLLRYKDAYYKAVVEDDVKRFQIEKPDLARLAEPFNYADELANPRTMKADKDSFETPHLKLSTRVIKEWAQATGQRFRYEHIVLTITNKTDRHLAYRVETAIDHPEKCGSKGALAHNAVALAPGESIERTECLWRPGGALTLKHVEVMELPLLSYHYVSRLVPTHVLLDERTTTGHEAPKSAKLCAFVPWREIQASVKLAGTRWADLIDFYARHNCDEYSYWPGYKRWLTPGKLPSVPPGKAPPPPTAATTK